MPYLMKKNLELRDWASKFAFAFNLKWTELLSQADA
jgi:hypothetical protein